MFVIASENSDHKSKLLIDVYSDNDSSVQQNMLLLDTNVIMYVNVVTCLMVVASICSSLLSHSAQTEFRSVYFMTFHITKICIEFLKQMSI
jgi:hypothetical protein